MASPDVLDFDALLAPIEGENPAGTDIREDVSPTSIYYRIKDARRAARDLERQALVAYDQEVETPNWNPVLELGPEILCGTSKDLEVAAWLTEALVRKHGFAGLRDGYRLVRELAERFWDQLYPLPDEYGMETRVFPLSGLNGGDTEGTLIAPIENCPITPDGFSFANYRDALEIEKLDPDKRSQRLEEGAVSLTEFERSATGGSAEYYQTLLDDLNAALDEFGKVTEILDEKCGSDSPPSSNIRNVLVDIRDRVNALAGPLLGADEEAAAEGEMVVAQGGAVAGRTNGPIASREDALRVLLQVADFFRKTEPHNPVSYAVEQAVRWGRMSLPELLNELVPDTTAKDQMFKLVGIREENES